MTFEEACEKYEKEYIKFDNIENKLSSRPDIHAFILLNQLVPGNRNMVTAAEHDVFYLDVRPEQLDETATEEQMLDLIRCGVMYDSEVDGLSMFA